MESNTVRNSRDPNVTVEPPAFESLFHADFSDTCRAVTPDDVGMLSLVESAAEMGLGTWVFSDGISIDWAFFTMGDSPRLRLVGSVVGGVRVPLAKDLLAG